MDTPAYLELCVPSIHLQRAINSDTDDNNNKQYLSQHMREGYYQIRCELLHSWQDHSIQNTITTL